MLTNTQRSDIRHATLEAREVLEELLDLTQEACVATDSSEFVGADGKIEKANSLFAQTVMLLLRIERIAYADPDPSTASADVLDAAAEE